MTRIIQLKIQGKKKKIYVVYIHVKSDIEAKPQIKSEGLYTEASTAETIHESQSDVFEFVAVAAGG